MKTYHIKTIKNEREAQKHKNDLKKHGFEIMCVDKKPQCVIIIGVKGDDIPDESGNKFEIFVDTPLDIPCEIFDLSVNPSNPVKKGDVKL